MDIRNHGITEKHNQEHGFVMITSMHNSLDPPNNNKNIKLNDEDALVGVVLELAIVIFHTVS